MIPAGISEARPVQTKGFGSRLCRRMDVSNVNHAFHDAVVGQSAALPAHDCLDSAPKRGTKAGVRSV